MRANGNQCLDSRYVPSTVDFVEEPEEFD